MTFRSALTSLALSLAAVGCGEPKDDDTSEPADSSDDSGDEATRGLPEGSSTWSGEGEAGGNSVLLEFSIENSGGDLEATVTYSDDPDAPIGIGTVSHTLVGTHEPTSGLVALAPLSWVEVPDLPLELLGFFGTYDPDTKTLTGMVQDYASGSDNSLAGGPMSATWVSGDGEATVEGDRGEALDAGSHTATGTMQCTSVEREAVLNVDYDGQGALEGDLLIGDPTVDSPLGTFEVTGVHNPSTGGITLVPGLWIDPDHSTVTFFVDGTYDASSGAFTGGLRTNTDACPASTWNVTFQ